MPHKGGFPVINVLQLILWHFSLQLSDYWKVQHERVTSEPEQS